MIEILKFALSGFWAFIGTIIILNGIAYFAVNGLMIVWSRLMRMLMVRKHGWPPSHLDADADLKLEKKKRKNG